MKKYIFAIIGFILALISINTVYAATPNGWGFDVKRSTYTNVYDCNTSKCDASLNAHVDNIDDSTFYYWSYEQTNMSANGPGNMWAYLVDTPLSKDYLYSITSYVCSLNYSANLVLKDYYSSGSLANVYNKVDKGTSYFTQTLSNLSPYPYTTTDGAMGSCSYFTTIYKPSVNSKYVGVNFTVDMQRNNFASAFIGYKVDSLGLANNLSSSDIQNIIGSSGLASSSDINSLNTSITNIQNQLANNISIAENSINNNIDDAESNIIDSQEQTRDAIINNQNENTDKEIESQKVCKNIDKINISFDNNYLNSNGEFVPSSSWGVTGFINISKASLKIVTSSNAGTYYCFYGVNKNLVSCSTGGSSGSYITIPNDVVFARFSIRKSDNRPSYYLCQDGNQAMNDSINNVNDTLNNSDSSGATSDADSFFSGFTTNTFGLTSIITSPLNLINSLTSKTCSPLRLQIPFVNQNLDLPCMSTIYQQHFGTFLTIYQTITFGIISYWICIRIFALVKDFKNPDHDEIEVMDL